MVQRVIKGKVPYRIWNPHRISKSKEKKYSNQSRNNEIKKIGPFWSVSHLGESTISDLESPSNFQVREAKKYSNRSRNNEIKEIGPLWSVSHLKESTISDLESPSNFQVREKKVFQSVQKQRNYALIKNAKIVMFKWT